MSSADPSLRALIEATYEDRSRISAAENRAAIEKTIAHLDRGELRVAERRPEGEWVTHAWDKQAILLYFALRGMDKMVAAPFEFYDKIPLKKDLDQAGVRQKKFPAGEFSIPCALIIGKRSESTDRKVSLNDALRDFAVPV